MKQSDAVRVVTLLGSAYRTELSDETALLWSEGLEAVALTDALEAVKALGRSSRFMPALAELLAEARYHRDLRLEREGHALPGDTAVPFADEFGTHHPDGRKREAS